MIFKRAFLLCLSALGSLALTSGGRAGDLRSAPIPSPVVVELFTSQGCSSCPPADNLLGELTKRPDVLALSLHVDYWNGLGWPDPFASTALTARQRAYATRMKRNQVYTPQMVINGQNDAVGSDRRAVNARIDTAKHSATIAARLTSAAAGWLLELPQTSLTTPATLWLVTYDLVHETRVARGENGGRNLHNYHVVRSLDAIGQWDGSLQQMSVPKAADESNQGRALLLQADGTGPILWAAALDP